MQHDMTIICTKIELPATHDDIDIEQQQGVNITGIERPNNSFLKRAYKYSFSNEIHPVEKIAKEADETLFFKTKCRQHCLNPILMSFQNVGFSSAKTRALTGVYTDMYDDGAILHCFLFLFFCLIVLIVFS